MINCARSLAITVGLAIAATLAAVAIPAASQATSEAVGPDSVWDEAGASAAARQRGVRVEVGSKTSETTQVFANADGSFTLEQSPTPQRARTSSGDWAHIDTSLTVTSDGSLQPRNTVHPVSISGGGDKPFATIHDGDRSLAVSWPLGTLPTPTVEGPSATYPAVLPDVDLVATATPTGFTHVLVVKTREAAAHPALKKIAFGFQTDGVTVQRTEVGGMQATDGEGDRVFTSPTPMMWDSSSSDSGLSRAVATSEVPKQAAMNLAVADGSVSVTPDQQMLADPDTAYPVFIDPAWSGGKVSNSWTTIWSQFPGDSFWQRTNTEDGYGDATGKGAAKVGNFGASTVRTLFKMDLSQVSGKQILDAKFRIHQKWSWNCSSSYGAAKIWLTIAPDPSTTWNNNVYWHEGLTADGYAPYGQSCGGGEGDVEFNATPIVQNEAAFRTDFGLGMRAVNESDNNYWKRYDHDSARVVVTYNTVPTAPTDLRVDDRPAGNPRPVVGSLTPTLQVKVHDADGDTSLRNTFSWDKRNADGTWSNVGTGAQSNLRDGDTASYAVSPALADKGIYRFSAQTSDSFSAGPASEFVEFEVDNDPPTIAPTVSSSDYGNDLNQTYGSIGKTGDFTFAANGEGEIVGYRWGWIDPPTNTVATASAGASVTWPITPPGPDAAEPTHGGQLTLHVASYDAAGRASPVTKYPFYIGSSSSPVADWKLDESAGSTTAADSSGNGHDATINGAIAGAPGRIPGASTSTAFDGADDSLSTTGPVLDTARSFTVSAWVRVDDANAWQTFISQDGSRTSPLFLQYNPAQHKWALALIAADSDDLPPPAIVSSAAAQIGMWTHLAAVYDAEGQARLYVNGQLSGSSAAPRLWNAVGPMNIGAVRHQGNLTNFVHGAMADVRVWDRVVSGAEIGAMSSPASAQWNLDGDGSDALSLGHDANPSDGVSWTEDRASNPDSATNLNGTSGWLETSGPAVRTDQSFEVTAWAKLPETGGGRVQTIASQDAVHTAAFTLGYDGTRNKWMFSMAGADSATAPATVEVLSDLPANAGQWVHLVGRYDTLTDGLLLFVNGQPQTSTTAKTSGIDAQGAFAIGRRKQADIVSSDLFRGDIDDVRAFAGLIADKSGANIVLRAPAAASSSAPPEWGWTLDKVNDGVRGPRGWSSWSSTDVDHQEWVAIKLPGKQAINRVDLFAQSDGAQTGEHFPANFTIEIWKGTTWLPVLSRTNYPKPTDGSAHTFTFDTTITDEVLIRGTNVRQMIFAEVEVFRALHRDANSSTTTGNLAFGANVSASSSAPTDWGWSTAYVNDARRDRGWSSWSSTDVDHTEWIELALPSTTEINRVDLHPRSDGLYTGDNFPANFTIEAWDGSKWVTVVSRTNHPKPTDGAGQIFTFDPRTTSKIRVVGTGLRVMQFSEIEIYGAHQ